jgi:hypothetical protein
MPDVTGTYALRGAAFLHHDAECDASVAAALGLADPHTEVLAEVMDPTGATIAYFAERDLAERFCAWMNSPPALPVFVVRSYEDRGLKGVYRRLEDAEQDIRDRVSEMTEEPEDSEEWRMFAADYEIFPTTVE